MSGYSYFNEHHKLIAIDLSKQVFNADVIIRQINFMGTPGHDECATVIFYVCMENWSGCWRILKWYIFWGLSAFEILGALYLVGETWYFLAPKLWQKRLTLYFLVFIFHEDLMKKILYFPKKISVFSVILGFMQLSRNSDC